MIFYPPTNWYTTTCTCDEFLLGMAALGEPFSLSLVGNLGGESWKGSTRDVDLPLHQDGVRTEALAAVQDGNYLECPDVDYVGLYCLRAGAGKCVTRLRRLHPLDGISTYTDEIELRAGQALVFDNRELLHGRGGPVGARLLLRAWVRAK
jgi:hypothetical protein